MLSAANRRFFRQDGSMVRRLRAKRKAQCARLGYQLQCAKGEKDFKQLDSFHHAIRPYLCLSQVFGLMPLANVSSGDPQAVNFRIRSIGMCFTVLFLLLGGMKTLNVAMRLFQAGLNAKNMVGLVFFCSSMITCINFISLACRWQGIIVPWSCVDIIMLFPPYKPARRSLANKLLILGCVLGGLALFEHALYHLSNYFTYRMEMLQCQPNATRVTFGSYVEKDFADVFELLPFNFLSACWALFLNATFTFIWNYMDLFVMLISIGLAERFQQFAARVSALTGRHVPDTLWFSIRQDHIRLCELMELVNANMSNTILLSSLNNMYFICHQLLNIFTQQRYLINYVYFWYSLFFLLGRTASVFMCASKIHDAALLPLQTVFMVSSDSYTDEVHRFFQQLTSEPIGLSGHRFYLLTRMSFFGLMSTLITYEFMLLQFDMKNSNKELPDVCAANRTNLIPVQHTNEAL